MIKITVEDSEGNGVRMSVVDNAHHDEALQVADIVANALSEANYEFEFRGKFLDEE